MSSTSQNSITSQRWIVRTAQRSCSDFLFGTFQDSCCLHVVTREMLKVRNLVNGGQDLSSDSVCQHCGSPIWWPACGDVSADSGRIQLSIPVLSQGSFACGAALFARHVNGGGGTSFP
jgi:hypothetical protein